MNIKIIDKFEEAAKLMRKVFMWNFFVRNSSEASERNLISYEVLLHFAVETFNVLISDQVALSNIHRNSQPRVEWKAQLKLVKAYKVLSSINAKPIQTSHQPCWRALKSLFSDKVSWIHESADEVG